MALAQAKRALSKGEVPVGAVIADADGEIIAKGYNLREASLDPTAHAEMIAIRRAAKRLGTWRLTDCAIFVTVEPCPMCMGAIIQARIKKVIYGCKDPKAGACGSVADLSALKRLNHRVEIEHGVMEDECSLLLKDFFKKLRHPPKK